MRRRRNQRHAGRRVAQLGDLRRDFVAGQLAAFAGLGALRDFDLQLFRIGQVVGSHAEAGTGDLLDGAILRIAVRTRHVPLRVLAALAGIARAADAVHGDSQTFVGFFADGAVAHRPCRTV
jgi:hypothetical protein